MINKKYATTRAARQMDGAVVGPAQDMIILLIIIITPAYGVQRTVLYRCTAYVCMYIHTYVRTYVRLV